MAIGFEVRDGVARVTLNRPEVLNAMDPATYDEVTAALRQIDGDPEIGRAHV